MSNILAKTLIKISKKDLEVSEKLYKLKYYPQSYFYFQQATEKSNKAFGLLTGIITEEDCLKIGHDQMKIYTKGLKEQKDKLEKHFKIISKFPNIQPHPNIPNADTKAYYDNVNTKLSFIDSLRNTKLEDLTSYDLNYLLDELDDITECDVKLPKNFESALKPIYENIILWFDSIPTVEARKAKEEMRDYFNNKSNIKEFKKALVKYVKLIKELGIIEYTLYCCAIITIQHSSKTRYPVQNFSDNPVKLYNSKLPLIRKQLEFIGFLKIAQSKLEKLIKVSSSEHEKS